MAEDPDPETLMTQQSDSLTILLSQDGRKAYRFTTPLLENYGMATEPYMEFRKGIYIETYDSLGGVASTIKSDYAIHFENRDLWEAKGNVVVTNTEGQALYTQQLFWNRKTKKIYSNVDSRFIEGTDVLTGEGFEADDYEDATGFRNWRFRRLTGRMAVNVEATQPADSTAQEPAAQRPLPAKTPQPAESSEAATEEDTAEEEVAAAAPETKGTDAGEAKDAASTAAGVADSGSAASAGNGAGAVYGAERINN